MKSLYIFSSVVLLFTAGCAATNDSRTGLRGEFCAFGFCLTPQAMSAESVPVPVTEIKAGPLTAPATVISQPAVAERHTEAVVAAPMAQPYAQPLPPPVSYTPQLAK